MNFTELPLGYFVRTDRIVSVCPIKGIQGFGVSVDTGREFLWFPYPTLVLAQRAAREIIEAMEGINPIRPEQTSSDI